MIKKTKELNSSDELKLKAIMRTLNTKNKKKKRKNLKAASFLVALYDMKKMEDGEIKIYRTTQKCSRCTPVKTSDTTLFI